MPMLDFRVETFLAVCRHMNVPAHEFYEGGA